MKKLLTLLVVVAFVLSAGLAIADQPENSHNAAYGYDVENGPNHASITTSATVAGTSGGGTGDDNQPPVIKVKWEYDLNVTICCEDQCDPWPCSGCEEEGTWLHDADPYVDGLQVKPILGGEVTVGYYAVVTDPQGVNTVDKVYADIWHPDGTFKYQIELHPVGFNTGVYDKTEALAIWNHAQSCHHDLLTYDETYFSGMSESEADVDILDQINEQLAYVYYAEAKLSYHQPGGYYCVGVRGHDTFGSWSDHLLNQFWYIPTSAVDIDFTSINYGSAVIGTPKWVGGDKDMQTPNKPTVRNVGNTDVALYVKQNHMGFGKTDGNWNVEFDARLSADGDDVVYDPDTLTRIPGVLELCTLEKLDFSIHIKKGMPAYDYSGSMDLYADIDGTNWNAIGQFVEIPPLGVPTTCPCE